MSVLFICNVVNYSETHDMQLIKCILFVYHGLHELKQHKPWFDEECLHFLDERKQAKLQWVQDPSQRNVDNLNNVRREASRHFRNKKNAYLKAKIEDLSI